MVVQVLLVQSEFTIHCRGTLLGAHCPFWQLLLVQSELKLHMPGTLFGAHDPVNAESFLWQLPLVQSEGDPHT